MTAKNPELSGCVDVSVKNIITTELFKRLADLQTDGMQGKRVMEIINMINESPPCNEGEEEASEDTMSMLFGARSKKSEYQDFMSECLKGKEGKQPEKMKACAAEWRGEKKEEEQTDMDAGEEKEEGCPACAIDVALGMGLNVCKNKESVDVEIDCDEILEKVEKGEIDHKEAFEIILKAFEGKPEYEALQEIKGMVKKESGEKDEIHA